MPGKTAEIAQMLMVWGTIFLVLKQTQKLKGVFIIN